MPTNEARKVDSWDEEVTDVAPKQVDSWDEEVVDEPVKKKVTPSLNLLSGVIPSGKALLTGQKEESAPTEQKQIDLTNAPIAEDESTRTDKFIRKPIDKKKVDEIYTLSKQNESLVDEFAKSHFVLDNLSQTEAIKQLNDLYAKREQAKDPQTAQAIDNQIEVIKSQPVEKQPSIQEAVLQNAQKYGNQPQDFNRPEIPMNPLTPNQILERNGMKTANTVGELHDRYIESATKLNELRPELDRTATELDAFKKDARTADFKTDKSGNKTLEGLADIPEAFGHGFGGTMKSIEQGFVNLLGDKQDRIDYAKKRYLEDNILYPTRTKGMATSGSEMIGGVAPYVIATAVLPETALLGHVIINGLTMGASGYGNGYYEMFAKQKQQGASDEEADAIAMQNAKFEGAKETAIGASLPFMGGAGSKLFLAPAEKSAMKQFLATQGVIIPTFTAGKLASNVYQKYGLGEKDVNLGDGLAETAENGLILGAMMEFAHKAPPKLKELYRANLSEQYPSIQQSVDKAVKDGVMDASQGYAFTEKLKRDFAVFNAMPKDITTEQKLLIEPETKQIIELSSREPSAVESPEVTKDKIVQLQKQVAEKLGTPLTEKETKLYEKLQEIKSSKEDKLTPSEKTELEHFDKRIKASEENQAKLEEEAKVVEDEEQTPPALKDVESTAKALEGKDVTIIEDAIVDKSINQDRNYEDDSFNTYVDYYTENDYLNEASKQSFDKLYSQLTPKEKRTIDLQKNQYWEGDGYYGNDLDAFYGSTDKEARLTFFNIEKGNVESISEAYHKAKKDGSNPELVKAVEHFLKETTKAETPTKTSTQEDVLKPFADIINESNSFEEAFDKVRSIKDVPQETADAFSQKYATEQGTSPQQAFRKFYDEVKSQKSATTETGKSGSGDIEIAKRVNNLGEFDNEIRGVTNQRRIPNEIKERYIEALRTLAINKEIGIDHPQAKRYESVYDILDANEKKKEPNKKFNKEDTFSEKSKSYFTPHELIPNVGESFDDAQKRAEKHFGMKSPYPIELIKEAKEIFSGFSYASEGFNDYVYERMQESTKKTTEPSLSQKEDKFVTKEISFDDAKKEYESIKEKYKKHLKKDGEFRANTPDEVKQEIRDAYLKMKTLVKQERERLVSEDKRDTGLFDGIDRIRNNNSAFNIVRMAMERGLIPERLYNEFGKNLLHIVADAKDVNEVTAQTAEIVQDFMNRENIKVDDVIARELQLAENLRFETKEEQTIFDKYDLSGLDNKPSERKAVIKKAVEEMKQTSPEKAERVREIMTNFDKLKTKLQGLDERVTKIKIEC